jgi:hypothetical protein
MARATTSLPNHWESAQQRRILGPCLTGQESARRTPTNSPSSSLTLQPERARISKRHLQSGRKIPPQSLLGDWEGKGEVWRGRKSFHRSGDKRSLQKLRARAGAGATAGMPSNFPGASQVIERRLTLHLNRIEELMAADCLVYFGPMMFGADDSIRDAVESLASAVGKRRKLVFILETGGGYAEVVRRISDALRHHYRVVDFLVPNNAMSAGTILVMSGDAIHMDYHSVLGPIDPQVENQDGKLIPALGYLLQYEELLAKANTGTITTAEMAILLNFDQGNLYSYQQARDLSVALLEEWLVKYKFKDWKKTETSRKRVNIQMKRDRAKEIGRKLNEVKRWNSHGIGISMEVLRKELNLRIDDFGEDVELNQTVRRYHALLTDYMAKNRHRAVLQTREAYEPLIRG